MQPSQAGRWALNHWTTREAPFSNIYIYIYLSLSLSLKALGCTPESNMLYINYTSKNQSFYFKAHQAIKSVKIENVDPQAIKSVKIENVDLAAF